MSYTLTKKGQVTIPKHVREKLGVKPGEAVDFRITDGGDVIVRPANAPRRTPRPISELIGAWGPGLTTDEVLRMTRGDDDE